MGYCIDMVESNLIIEKENIEGALQALKDFMLTKTRLMWVTPKDVINASDVFEAFEEIRYPLNINMSGDYIIDYFSGEKLGDDKEIWNSIAKFVNPNSCIEFKGEDGEIFRLKFDGKECTEEWD